ncbi:hypothetical protein Bhyg_03235 [Pseudolycoriella hygida]|uniref:PHD-type domain-containing protein n=1 Tax=Pseudolycoriella hygida TaxID=35572 RepID=A0A9Q0S9B6_9DIPT|nr:hypothetical protein Bhyg_03235 [Pseudolycoriella hygida]
MLNKDKSGLILEIIQCMYCEKYFHWECVNVDETIEEEEEWWMCSECHSSIYGSPNTNSSSDEAHESEDSSSSETRATISSESNVSYRSDSSSKSSKTEGTSSSESRGTRSTSTSDHSEIEIISEKDQFIQCVTMERETSLSAQRLTLSKPCNRHTKSFHETETQIIEGNALKAFPENNQQTGANRVGLMTSTFKGDWSQRHRNKSSRRITVQQERSSLSKIRKIVKENAYEMNNGRKFRENQFNNTSYRWEPDNEKVQRSTYENSSNSKSHSGSEYQFDNTMNLSDLGTVQPKVGNQHHSREFGKFENQFPCTEVQVYTVYDQEMGFNIGKKFTIIQQGYRELY